MTTNKQSLKINAVPNNTGPDTGIHYTIKSQCPVNPILFENDWNGMCIEFTENIEIRMDN